MIAMKNLLLSAIFAAPLLLGTPAEALSLNTKISGIDGPNVNVVNGQIVIDVTLANVSVDAGATIPLPHYPNSNIEISPDFESGGTLIEAVINESDFLAFKGSGFGNLTLPGGRLLPGIAGGVLPGIAVSIPQLANSVFYASSTAIGLFIPIPKFSLSGVIISSRFYNSANQQIGLLAAVSNDSAGKNGGVLVLLSTALLGIK